MKKLFFILFCGMMGAATLNAQTWQIGSPNAADVIATLENGTLTISGTGNVQSWNTNLAVPWNNVGASIITVIIEAGINSFNNRSAFLNCKALTSIEVAFDNPVFSSDDGVLFNKDQTTLIQYPAGKQGAYTIPNSVTSIEIFAFSGCTGLTSVTIPASVQTISNGAFSSSAVVSVTVQWATPPVINSTVFSNIHLNSTQLIVPPGAEEAYSTADVWKDFYIEGISSSLLTGEFGDDLTWTFDIVSGELSISGTGAMPFNLPWRDFRNKIQTLVIYDGVETIGNSAFIGCISLTSVTIPASVYFIVNSAFSGCTGLMSINVAADNPYYSSENGVLFSKDKTTLIQYPAGKQGAYTIPNSVISIGGGAFSGCTGLTEITISDAVTSIDYGAFSGCTSLISVVIPASVESIGDYAFSRCANLTSIHVAVDNPYYSSENGVLFNKDKITLIQYPEGKQGAYIIPNSVISIENNAFSYCIGLTEIIIPDSVESIGNDAFSYCTGLTEIIIPDSVESIGNNAFSYCTGLTEIIIPDSVESIGYSAFFGCAALESVIIPNSVTSIGMSAFYDCTSLISVTIPASVESIGIHAFRNCTSLKSIYIPASVESIGMSAFSFCTSLESVIIGAGVITIDILAFDGCTNLTEIINHAIVPQTIVANVFQNVGISGITLFVPAGSVAAYQVAEVWSNFGNIRAIIVPVAGVSLDETKLILDEGESVKLTATVSPADATNKNVTWTSSDDEIATVDQDGNVTGISEGVAIITVTTEDGGFTDVCEVTVTVTVTEQSVTPAVISVVIVPNTATVQKGATQEFEANVTVEGGASQDVTWSVSGDIGSTATVINSSGVLTVGANETATTLTVTATSVFDDTKSGTATVTVTEQSIPPAVISVVVTPSAATVQKGATQEFEANVTVEGDASTAVTWSVSGDIGSTATVINSSGVLTVGANETAATLTVRATSTADAEKWDEATVTVSSGNTTNVEEVFIPDLKIYPNPFTGEVRITGAVVETRHATSVQMQMQIINASGALVHTQTITNNDEIINLEHLPAGMYIFRFEKDGKAQTVRVVKE